jgi:hypothetical protein
MLMLSSFFRGGGNGGVQGLSASISPEFLMGTLAPLCGNILGCPYSPPSNSSAEKITPHSIVEANPTRTPHPMLLSHPQSLPEHNQSPPATDREPHVPRADAIGARGPPGRHARGAEPAAVPQPHWQLYRLDRLWPRRQGALPLCGTLSTRSRSRCDRRMRCFLGGGGSLGAGGFLGAEAPPLRIWGGCTGQSCPISRQMKTVLNR